MFKGRGQNEKNLCLACKITPWGPYFMRSHASPSMPSHGPLNSCQRAVLTVTLRSSSQVEDLPVGKLSRNTFWNPSQHDCADMWAGHTLTVWFWNNSANAGRKAVGLSVRVTSTTQPQEYKNRADVWREDTVGPLQTPVLWVGSQKDQTLCTFC